jgi:hypothetical protein
VSVPLSPRSQSKLMTNIYRKITNGVVNLRALEPAWLTDLFITHCDLYIENRHSQTEGTWIIFYSMTPEHRNGNETQLWSGNMCFWNLKPRAEADGFSVPITIVSLIVLWKRFWENLNGKFRQKHCSWFVVYGWWVYSLPLVHEVTKSSKERRNLVFSGLCASIVPLGYVCDSIIYKIVVSVVVHQV